MADRRMLREGGIQPLRTPEDPPNLERVSAIPFPEEGVAVSLKIIDPFTGHAVPSVGFALQVQDPAEDE